MAISNDINNTNYILVKSPKIIRGLSLANSIRSRFTLELPINVSNADVLHFQLLKNSEVVLSIYKNFVINNDSNLIYNVLIGNSREETMSNLYNSLLIYNQIPDINYVLNDNIIYIDIYNDETNTYSLNIVSNGGDIVFSGPTTQSGVSSFDQTEYIITYWSGLKNIIDIPGTNPNEYKVMKNLLNDEQKNTYIDVSPIISNNFESDIISYGGNTTFYNLQDGLSKWVKVKMKNKLNNSDKNERTDIYYSLDGWSDVQKHKIPNVLLNGQQRMIENNIPTIYITRALHRNADFRIYYQTTMINNEILVRNEDDQTEKILVGAKGNPLYNTQYIKSVKIPFSDKFDVPFNKNMEVTFHYITGDILLEPPTNLFSKTVVKIEIIDECKYPVVTVVFKNRYGVLETLSFGKVSKRNLKTKRENIKHSIVDINGVVNYNTHSEKNYNVNGKEEYILNTGFIGEFMNSAYEDLYMSDEIYIKDSNMINYIPVLLKDSDFDRKTKRDDKLINYTFKFETSHNKKYDLI